MSYKKNASVNLARTWEAWKGEGRVGDDIVSSFIISEIPDMYGLKELFDVFKEFGLVVEVVIPPRREKRGKRFGFVRFWKVKKERMLSVKLDNIFIEGKKIHANIPKFHRQEAVTVRHQPSLVLKPNHKFGNTNVVGSGFRRFNTYAQVVNNWRNMQKETLDKAQHPSECGKGAINLKLDFAHRHFKIEDADLSSFNKAFIGVVEEVGMSYNIQEAFNMEGFFRVKATPLVRIYVCWKKWRLGK